MDITQLSITLDSSEVFHGQTNNVIMDILATANGNYGSISGNNLWTITTWLSNNQLGSGRIEANNPTLRSDLVTLPVNSGQTAVFMDVNYLLDLTVSPTCNQFSYICVEIAMNPGASVDFELTGDLMACTPLTCTGMFIFKMYSFTDHNLDENLPMAVITLAHTYILKTTQT